MPDRDAMRAVEGADDDYDFWFSADDDCPLCGGSGFLENDDEESDPREPCPDCGGRP